MLAIPTCTFEQAQLTDVTVIVRIDGNVPLKTNGTIDDDSRLKAVLPTLERIKQKGGRSVILTHLGNPENEDQKLSTHMLVPWFIEHGFTQTVFAPDIATAKSLESAPFDLLVLENLRFFKEEQERSQTFANQLASLGTYFVQDAFGALHRDHTSISLLPLAFDAEHRSIGLLVQKELIHLTPLLENPSQPFVALVGGVKAKTKLPLLRALLPRVNTLLIAPPLCFTFLKALNKPIGRSAYEPDMVEQAGLLLEEAEERYVRVVLPDDFLATDTSFENPQDCYPATELNEQEIGVSIGPRTTDHWSTLVHNARSLFCNGLPGNKDYPETLTTVLRLLQAFPRNQHAIIAGGDTNALIKQLHIQVDGFLSTGGGSTLALLSNETLPGLIPFM